ncbi:unnamed protein product [Fraxinus pennsylvanica]|uniref:Uncharacterized protein n=1 Tax=Fraxinus pennsylvanica TaxID=56036 RepID=A0AAD2DWV2_9LAMI|nr:unnamed protein product [Fraxinus pennsylvanica]
MFELGGGCGRKAATPQKRVEKFSLKPTEGVVGEEDSGEGLLSCSEKQHREPPIFAKIDESVPSKSSVIIESETGFSLPPVKEQKASEIKHKLSRIQLSWLNEEDLKLLETPQVSVVADYVKVLKHKPEMVLSLSNYVVPDGGESYPIDIEESRGDKLGPVVFNAESKNESTSTSVKRKSIDQRAAVGNNDVLRRQSKWNSGALKVPKLQGGNIVGSIKPMDPFKPVSKLNFSRFNSRVSEEMPKERVVPPSAKSHTSTLRIDNFLCPVTLKAAVQELLGKRAESPISQRITSKPIVMFLILLLKKL